MITLNISLIWKNKMGLNVDLKLENLLPKVNTLLWLFLLKF